MLKINKIQLYNFMKHRDLELDFTEGINSILGKNGVGKSSIITAIGFTIFNYNTKDNQTQLISKEKSTAKVTINFTVGNIEYVIERSIGTVTYASLSYTENGEEKKLHTPKLVYQKMSEILEIDNLPRIYENILSIRSSGIVSPFIAELQKRRSFFIGSLGLEKYEQVWSGLRPVISNLEGRISADNSSRERGTIIRKKISALRKQIDELQPAVEVCKDKLKIKMDEAVRLRLILDENREELKEKYKYEAELESLKKRHHSLLKKLSNIQKEINSLENIKVEICPTCGQPLDNKSKEKYNENKLNTLLNSKAETESTIITLKNQINVIELTLEEFREYDYEFKLQSLESEIMDYQRDIEIANHKITLNEDMIKSYSEEIKEVLKSFRKLSSAQKSIKVVNKIRDGMRRVSSTINVAMIQDVSSIGSHFLSDIKNSDCRIDILEDYRLLITIDGESFEFNQLSDGTQVMVGLAIRLAMTRFCSDLGIVFLDEPTINLHSSVRSNLLEAIKRLGFSQIFVISHDDTFVSQTDNVIHIGLYD